MISDKQLRNSNFNHINSFIEEKKKYLILSMHSIKPQFSSKIDININDIYITINLKISKTNLSVYKKMTYNIKVEIFPEMKV